MKVKQCSNCKELKPLDFFYKCKHHNDDLKSECKTCSYDMSKPYLKMNHERIKQNKRVWYWKHREREKLKMRQRRTRDPEASLKYKREYDRKNRDRINKQKKIWRADRSKETIDRLNKQRRERYNTDINYKLATNIRTRIQKALRLNLKHSSSIGLLGCSINQLREHLTLQFQSGMNWKNYGYYGWHIDHIVPCSLFDLSKPEEQKACFHYTNLQPLWRADNQTKSGRTHEQTR